MAPTPPRRPSSSAAFPEDSHHPGRGGQPLRASHPETFDRLQRTGAKIFRNDEHGDVIVTIKEGKVEVVVTKSEAAF